MDPAILNATVAVLTELVRQTMVDGGTCNQWNSSPMISVISLAITSVLGIGAALWRQRAPTIHLMESPKATSRHTVPTNIE